MRCFLSIKHTDGGCRVQISQKNCLSHQIQMPLSTCQQGLFPFLIILPQLNNPNNINSQLIKKIIDPIKKIYVREAIFNLIDREYGG